MNSDEHGMIGALIALIARLSYRQKRGEAMSVADVIGSFFVGWLSGKAPDMLEPATGPSHRGLFHSIVLLWLLKQGYSKTKGSLNIDDMQKQLITEGTSAYISHLIIDSQSKKGLPFLI